MIPQIKEINFPEYATLSTATASLVDMGDKTITAQVKIDGSIAPDFSYDWEIEFQGERYIQPLREPQASKGNESISSIIDLTFYHKGIYDLKRYFFVSIVELEAGTLMADNYIVPLRLNISEFATYLNNVLKYYYGEAYKVFLNPDYEYDETDRKDININYTKIWDVLTKTYEWFGARWSWETQSDNGEYYFIKIGYPSIEVSHTFEYGFDGGLLKFERQVQDPEIANVIFGRGSSENIPYRYFKNKSDDNPTFPADPDWIPELENIYFANLRGKTFRDYVKGWKAKHYGGEVMSEPTEEYTRGYTDKKFNPIEYVANQESIAKYGEIQKGLEHNEEIKPTIQGISIDGIGRVDQVVDVEPILVDESTENTEVVTDILVINDTDVYRFDNKSNSDSVRLSNATSDMYYLSKDAHIIKDIDVSITQEVKVTRYQQQYDHLSEKWVDVSERKVVVETQPLNIDTLNVSVVDTATGKQITDIANIRRGTTIYISVSATASGLMQNTIKEVSLGPDSSFLFRDVQEVNVESRIITQIKSEIDCTVIHGQILGNYVQDSIRESQSISIRANGTSQVIFTTEQFTIEEKDAPATSIDMPFRVIASLDGAQYDARPNVVAINVDTGEQETSLNLQAGTYYLQNSIQITNLANESQTFKVELLPTYIYYSYDSASWKPTFDIWVKNIWQTKKKYISSEIEGIATRETDDQYAARVWDAILGNHLGDDAKVVFSSGWLSGHSDWEFPIAYRPVYDTSKSIDGVPSEWRITLYKSDSEIESSGKWLPSIANHANAGDYFYFTGIELPHQYVLWAEERLDEYKREELAKVMTESPMIVAQVDKVRLNKLQDNDLVLLLDTIKIGNTIRVADPRFIDKNYITLQLQSVTYTWDATTILLPNIEIVLSNDILKTTNPIDNIKEEVKGQALAFSEIKPLIGEINQVALKAKASAQKASTQVSNSETKIIETQILAEQAKNEVDANKEQTYVTQKQVNTLIGKILSDNGKSVREIATEVAEVLIPTEIATATQKIDARDLRLTTLEPNIMYDWSGSSLVSLTLPRLGRAQAGYEHKWMVRLTCGNSSQVTIPFTVTWINGVAPSWSTWSTVEFTFTKGNDDSVIYGEYKIFR